MGALETALAERKELIEAELTRRLPVAEPDHGRLVEAVRYALLGPGKRLRGAMVTWACEAVGGTLEQSVPAACAIEMLHAYTLVHDDLPAMDDDDERRGRPTVHKAFGEATAILAGDALLTHAFGVLVELREPPVVARCLHVLARAAGLRGVLRGQARDLLLADQPPTSPVSFEELEDIAAEKTGALYSAAAEMGGAIGEADAKHQSALRAFGRLYGIAFQHADDLDDGDRPEHSARAAVRMTELIASAKAELADLHDQPGARMLCALADRLAIRPN